MANVLFIDSFDNYNNENGAAKYPDLHSFNIVPTNGADYAISSSYGRNGQGLRILTGGHIYDGQTNLVRLSGMGGPRSTWGFGFAFKILDNPPKNSVPIFGLVDTGTIYSYLGQFYATQIAVYLSRAQTIRMSSGEPEGTTLISSSYSLRRNTWHYIEATVTLSASGVASLSINGEVVGSFSGDTRGTGSSSADGIRIGFGKMERTVESSNGQRYFCIDDVYVTDGNNLGDIANKAIRPIADGSLNNWSPSTGVSNYQMVDDDTPDNDTTYIFAPSTSLDNVFSMVDISAITNVVIPALQIAATGRAPYNLPSAAANGIVRIGGVNYFSTAIGLGTPFAEGSNGYMSYDHRTEIFPYTNNPATGGTWSPATITSSEFGVERTA